MEFTAAFLIGFASLVFSLHKAIARLRGAEDRIARSAERKQAQVDRIRRAGHINLTLARERAALLQRKLAMELDCEELEEQLKSSGNADRRLYVLDDRRTPADQAWIVRLSNRDYASRVNDNLEMPALDTWKKGRRFLVWALDEAKARSKVQARYPDRKGFTIQSIEPDT
jgi:hypothetical protein